MRLTLLRTKTQLKFLLAFLAVLVVLGCNNTPDYLFINYSDVASDDPNGYYPLRRTRSFKLLKVITDNPADSLNPTLTKQYVSIAELDEHHFVIANYVNLLLFDRRKGTICKIDPLRALEKPRIESFENSPELTRAEKIEKYNPTGVFVDKDKNIYIANYKGNNILRGKIDIRNCTARFDGSFSSPNTGGPENVVVDKDRDVLVSANYDEGTVTAFRVSDGSELWSSKVGQAHGVAIIGEIVYATGLSERKIYKISLADGRHLASKGALGWDPMKAQFMWPTSISPLKSGQLVVSDGQSGFLSVVDPETLDVVRFTGGNGPSFDLFNYPYAATKHSGGVVVVSANRGQILFLNDSVDSVIKEFRFEGHRWPSFAKKQSPFGADWVGYVSEGPNRLSIDNSEFKLGFGHLYPESAGPVLRVPNIATLYNRGSYMYFLQGANVAPELSFFFSSSSPTLIGIARRPNKPSLILSREIPVDSWLVGETIVNIAGTVLQLGELKAELMLQADEFYRVIDRNGWLTKEQLYQLGDFREGGRKLGYEEYLKSLDRVFYSAAGREFKLVYDRCSVTGCEPKTLRDAAAKYYAETSGAAYVNIDEYVLVGMIGGVGPPEGGAREGDIVFDTCNVGQWYGGYGLEALTTRTLTDYLSAIDLKSSVICVRRKDEKAFSVRSILLGWYSSAEAAQSIEILAVSNAESNTEWLSLGTFDVPRPFEIDGYFFSSVQISDPRRFAGFKVRLVQGGAQNRLILRSLTVDENQPKGDVSARSRLAGAVSSRVKYGNGVTKITGNSTHTLATAASALARADSAKSRDYALMFVASLGPSEKWRVLDLIAIDGRVHTVVEVDDSGRIGTYDPTLGITYKCSIDELIGGACDYGSAVRTVAVNPALEAFEGAGFFYGAKVNRTYSEQEELLKLYR